MKTFAVPNLMIYRPSTLVWLPCLSFECLDSFIHGKIFLLMVNLRFCCFDPRGSCREPPKASFCVGSWWSNPLPSSKDLLKKSFWWILCVALCISIKSVPGPLWPCDRTLAAKCHMAGFQRAMGFWPERIQKKRKTESGRRLNDPSYQLNSILTWIATLNAFDV